MIIFIYLRILVAHFLVPKWATSFWFGRIGEWATSNLQPWFCHRKMFSAIQKSTDIFY